MSGGESWRTLHLCLCALEGAEGVGRIGLVVGFQVGPEGHWERNEGGVGACLN
jgi:hypothetical protein